MYALSPAPADPILGLNDAFNADAARTKSTGAGAPDEQGRTPIMAAGTPRSSCWPMKPASPIWALPDTPAPKLAPQLSVATTH